MRLTTSMVIVGAIYAAPAIAQGDQVRRGPVPDWVVPSDLLAVPDNPTGVIFVRRQDTLLHLDAKGESQYQSFRIRILHPKALQLGNLSITWNPSSGAPVVHSIKIFRDGEIIDVLKQASFEILRREDQLEEARLDGNLTAVLRVADLRVGDELEFAVTTRVEDPTLGSDDAGFLQLAAQPAAGRFHLALSWVEGQKPNIKMTPDMAAVAQTSEHGVEFRFDNPAFLVPPKDAPTRYQWQRILEYSDFPDWAAVSRRFDVLFKKSAQLTAASPLKLEARRIAAAHADPFERASAALKLVQQDVRYIYVGFAGGNLTPASADETWQRRYGDCKGKSALLLALLGELGIDAEAILASNTGLDDGFDQRLPSPKLFDHVLVRARINGVVYYLDGTLPPVAGPSLQPVIPYKWVLPLTEPGSSIEQIAWQPAERPDEITLFELDARAGFAQPARITSTTIVRGVKGLQQQVQLSGLGADELLSGLRQQLLGGTWQTIESAEWHFDQKAQASVLTISGTGSTDWQDDGDGTKSLTLPGGGFNPPDRRIRPAEQDQNLPFFKQPSFDCYVTSVRLPAGTKPAQWSFSSSFDTRLFGQNYYRAFELRDGTIRMVRGFRTEQPEIDPALAKKDNERIASFDNSMARIYFDPASHDVSPKRAQTVPATYEIDWTAANVPCLASGTKATAIAAGS